MLLCSACMLHHAARKNNNMIITYSPHTHSSRTRVPPETDIMPIVDVSGSMTGTPMEVAIALGMVVAYCQQDEKAAYSRHFLTFDSTPKL